MDHRLRELQRRFQETGTFEDELAYLRARRRIAQLEDDRITKAAYFGNRAANELVPYEGPYTIARLMGRPMPEPPPTSWFCNSIYKGINSHDIADEWAGIDIIGTDNDLEDTKIETALLANLLLYRYLILATDLEPGWVSAAQQYNMLRDYFITGKDTSSSTHLSGFAITLHMLIWNHNTDMFPANLITELRWATERMLNVAEEEGFDAKLICDSVAESMQRYLLGYADLEQALPLIEI